MTLRKYLLIFTLLGIIFINLACAGNAQPESTDIPKSATSFVEETATQKPATASPAPPTSTATATEAVATVTPTLFSEEPKVKSTPNTPPQPQRPGKVAPRDDPPQPSMTDLARLDLAERLQVEAMNIQVIEISKGKPDKEIKNCLGKDSVLKDLEEVEQIILLFKGQHYHYLVLGNGIQYCFKTNAQNL